MKKLKQVFFTLVEIYIYLNERNYIRRFNSPTNRNNFYRS